MRFRWGSYTRHQRGGSGVEVPLDPRLDVFFTTLSARHFFGEGWAMDATLPVGLVRYDAGVGQGTGRISGLGDLQLGARYDLSALWGAGGYRPSVTVRLALGLPSGKQETVTGLQGVAPSLLATGFAAFSAHAQVGATQFVLRQLALQGSVSFSAPLTRTERGVRMGEQLAYGLGALWRPDDQIVVAGRLAGRWIARANEQTEGTVLNSGGRAFAAELDLTWIANESVAFTVGGRLPLYQDVNGQQIVETFSIGLGLALTFGPEEEDDDHAHGAEDEHGHDDERAPASKPASAPHDHGDAGAPDVSDLAAGGASFDAEAAAVPGKITVVDFWADWCQPCKVLTGRLTELAKQHPELAVRRVEVPDFDTEVAREHLTGVDALPTVWIVDPAGQRTVLAGRPVQEILQSVNEALEAER